MPIPESAVRVLLLPGWQNSGQGHWQTHWESAHGYVRVEQNDWLWPRRGDWMARLDEIVANGQRSSPAVLVAHSLGCQLVAAWAAHSQHTALVKAALLVAPPDVERADMPPHLFNWRPIERKALPFMSTLVSSSTDPYCTPECSAEMAHHWASNWVLLTGKGHLNAESALGDWPEGKALLSALTVQASESPTIQPWSPKNPKD